MKKMKLIKIIDEYINDKNFSMTYKNNKLNIMNYTKILDFSNEQIRISYLEKIYTITGTNLVISKMFEEELLITGNIIEISFNE